VHSRSKALALLAAIAACAGSEPAQEPGSAGRTPWEAARLRGASFRAVGNEPGWSVEIQSGERIVFETDYGQTRVATPLPAPRIESDPERTSYHARSKAHELTLVIEPGPCQDDMSGERFELRASVVLDGREHRGCGRALER
jgi:uncharacterized membrane protein